MYIDKRKDSIPKVGDRYVVVGVYPNTTDDLMQPRIEIVLELEKKPKEEQK
jgi:hypothetical protein